MVNLKELKIECNNKKNLNPLSMFISVFFYFSIFHLNYTVIIRSMSSNKSHLDICKLLYIHGCYKKYGTNPFVMYRI